MAKDNRSAREINWVRGVDTGELFDELVMTAENESAGYPHAPEVSARLAIDYVRGLMNDMLDELEDEVVEEVRNNWRCDE